VNGPARAYACWQGRGRCRPGGRGLSDIQLCSCQDGPTLREPWRSSDTLPGGCARNTGRLFQNSELRCRPLEARSTLTGGCAQNTRHFSSPRGYEQIARNLSRPARDAEHAVGRGLSIIESNSRAVSAVSARARAGSVPTGPVRPQLLDDLSRGLADGQKSHQFRRPPPADAGRGARHNSPSGQVLRPASAISSGAAHRRVGAGVRSQSSMKCRVVGACLRAGILIRPIGESRPQFINESRCLPATGSQNLVDEMNRFHADETGMEDVQTCRTIRTKMLNRKVR
jgi:hypothetical protein